MSPGDAAAGILAVVVLLILIAVGIAVYLLPWLVAGIRGARHAGAIAIINILLGWSLLGWAGAMLWACVDEKDRQSN